MKSDGPRDPIVGPDSGPEAPFPLRLNGKVIKGFGRGSKELGIPTANIPISGLTVGGHAEIESGVYYGWAGLSPSHAAGPAQHNDVGSGNSGAEHALAPTSAPGAVYPMVMSVGWNPFYKNSVRSVEVHIIHEFGGNDFYGSHMNLVILGFIRPELDYVSREALIRDIRTDIEVSVRCLEREAYQRYKADGYLLEFEGRGETAS